MNFHANLKLHILTLTWQHHLDFIFSFKFSSTLYKYSNRASTTLWRIKWPLCVNLVELPFKIPTFHETIVRIWYPLSSAAAILSCPWVIHMCFYFPPLHVAPTIQRPPGTLRYFYQPKQNSQEVEASDEGHNCSTLILFSVSHSQHALATCLTVAGGLSDSLPCLSVWPLRLDLKIDSSNEGHIRSVSRTTSSCGLGGTKYRASFPLPAKNSMY